MGGVRCSLRPGALPRFGRPPLKLVQQVADAAPEFGLQLSIFLGPAPQILRGLAQLLGRPAGLFGRPAQLLGGLALPLGGLALVLGPGPRVLVDLPALFPSLAPPFRLVAFLLARQADYFAAGPRLFGNDAPVLGGLPFEFRGPAAR